MTEEQKKILRAYNFILMFFRIFFLISILGYIFSPSVWDRFIMFMLMIVIVSGYCAYDDDRSRYMNENKIYKINGRYEVMEELE